MRILRRKKDAPRTGATGQPSPVKVLEDALVRLPPDSPCAHANALLAALNRAGYVVEGRVRRDIDVINSAADRAGATEAEKRTLQRWYLSECGPPPSMRGHR